VSVTVQHAQAIVILQYYVVALKKHYSSLPHIIASAFLSLPWGGEGGGGSSHPCIRHNVTNAFRCKHTLVSHQNSVLNQMHFQATWGRFMGNQRKLFQLLKTLWWLKTFHCRTLCQLKKFHYLTLGDQNNSVTLLMATMAIEIFSIAIES